MGKNTSVRTESTVLATETLRQALQVIYGKDVVFIKHDVVKAGAIRNLEDFSQEREIKIERRFVTVSDDGSVEPADVIAKVRLKNVPNDDHVWDWEPSMLEISIGTARYVVCVTGKEVVFPRLCVLASDTDRSVPQRRIIGRSCTDRIIVPAV